MSQFFERQFSQEDLQRQLAQRRHLGSQSMGMGMAMPIQGQSQQDDTMNMSGMLGGCDSLDDIIMQNSKELQRRQSMPRYGEQIPGDDHDRRSGMMQFGSPNDGLNSFQFTSQESSGPHENGRRMSGDDMDMATGFGDMTTGLGMGQSTLDFSASMQGQNSLALDTSGSYHDMSSNMMGDMMPYSDVQMSSEATPMDMFGPDAFTNPFNPTSMADFNMSMVNVDNSLSGRPNGSGDMSAENADEDMVVAANKISELNSSMARSLSMNQNMASYASPTSANVPQLSTNSEPFQSTPVPKIAEDAATERVQGPQKPPVQHDFKNVYSSSGFDMLGALMRVATRSNPEINIGAVDMSCAFVVCDITQTDCPIIYVSDIFERLTGYNKHEVLGRNCRFLQAPDGKVMPGVKRKYVDDDSVYYLKTRIKSQQEAQRSLINYRKGGQPFMNLLTMIPIAWDTDEIKYIVGFQVDLVEQPSSVAGKGQGGSYTVNYSQGLLPQYIWTPPEITRPDAGQTISRDDVSTVLVNFNNQSESELTKRMWDKVLLENTDDVVHVLSLKGLFLYLSPSSRHVLEYDASELVGTALSSVCHPSDIVPVTRELKDTSTGATVNVVFRIRRKNSGYTWFESHGSLCVEQGKGRKCIILVGRERPVYALGRHDIEVSGGIGENELWTKLSTSGMFLFVSSNVRILLDRHPDELVGTSIQALMRPKSKVEFGRCLERARTGKKVIYKHEIMNKRGQVLQAQTNLYPGDAAEGQKPTFLVGQTRLLRPPSRNMASAAHSNVGSGSHVGPEPIVSTIDQASQGSGATVSLLAAGDAKGDGQTRFATSAVPSDHVLTQAGGAGLAIGSQDAALASEDNIFDELKTTRCTSWQFELRQMEKSNRLLAEELASLLQNKKKRKRRKGAGHLQRDCANCHTRTTPEWRRGPSGNRDLCNSCGLRWAKQVSRTGSETSSVLPQNFIMEYNSSTSSGLS